MIVLKVLNLLKVRLLLIAVLFSMPLYTQAGIISFSAPDVSVETGNTFTIDLLADFTTEGTLGGGLDVFYDTSILSFQMFDFSTATLSLEAGFNRAPDNLLNKLEGLAFGSFAGISGSGVVGTFTFEALTEGMTLLQLAVTDNLLGGGPFISSVDFMSQLNIDAGSSKVNVTSPAVVPVPAAIWLFGSALGVLLFRGKVKA